MSAPTHLPPFDPANAVHRVKFHRAIRGPPLSDRAGGRAAPPPVPEQRLGPNLTPDLATLSKTVCGYSSSPHAAGG